MEEKNEVSKQLLELQELAKPIVDWLYTNGSPHSIVIIDQISAQLMHGALGVHFEPRG